MVSFHDGKLAWLKKLSVLILVLAIALRLRYGLVNHQYVTMRCLHSIFTVKHYLLADQARPTLSAEYRAFENVLQLKPLAKINAAADPAAVVEDLRANFAFDVIVPKPAQCQIDREVFEHDGHSVNAFWIQHHQQYFRRDVDKIVMYLHGGGYVAGNIHTYAGVVCHLSEVFNMTVLFVEYRLSPEHQYPGCVNDTVAAYRALLGQGISPSQLIIMGDSAGGGLTLLTVQALVARQIPVPRGAIVLSPWADFTTAGESHIRNRLTDIVADSDNFRWVISQLLGKDHSPLSYSNPLFSPVFGSFENFPPMYINMGTSELLEDDARQVATKARAVGVDVTLEEGLHLMHDYPLFFSYFPEAQKTLNNMHQWIQTRFAKRDNL